MLVVTMTIKKNITANIVSMLYTAYCSDTGGLLYERVG